MNISAAGMLVESTAPLFPGRTVKLHLIRASPSAAPDENQRGRDAPCSQPIGRPRPNGGQRVTLSGRVVRSYMATLDRGRGATFRSGIAFDGWFDAAGELTADGPLEPER